MTEQERISELYMSLKIDYWQLKRTSGNVGEIVKENEVLKSKNEVLRNKNTEIGDRNQALETQNNELKRRIKELEKRIPGLETNQIVTMTPKQAHGNQYVGLKKYEKMKRLMETMAGKVCDLTRDNEQLKRMIKLTDNE